MKKRFSKPIVLVAIVLLVIVLLLAGVLAAGIAMDPLDCKMAPGVTIGGLDVSGSSPLDAYKAVSAAAEKTILQEPLVVELPEETLTFSPDEVKMKFTAWKAVADAFLFGRKENAGDPSLGITQYLKFDAEWIRAKLEEYASRNDTVLTQPEWKLRGQAPELTTGIYDPEAPGQTVELTLGLPERHLDVDQTLQTITAAYDQSLAGLETLVLDVPAEKTPQEPNLQEIYDTCLIKGRDDSLDMQTYAVIPGAYSYHFDMENAKELVSAAQYGETVSIPMVAYAPEIYGEGVYFRDVLGACDTKHNTDENRNTNLRLVCQFLDGLVIQPGEEFSYNQAVGERTEERGFKPAIVYSGSIKTKDFGGGVCQGSTTLYNCLLLADMDVLERHGHGALVTYVDLGLDAAVNWSTKTDLIFRNNSHFPVKIQAEVSDGYMRMKLLGTDEKNYYIEMEASSYKEGDYYFAASYKCKYDKKTKELISRDRETYSTYAAELGTG